MIRFFLGLLLFLFSLLVNGQVKQNHVIAGEVTKLVASMPLDIQVDATSDSNTVRVEGTQEDLNHVSIRQTGSTLYVDMNVKKTKRSIRDNRAKVFISQSKIVDYYVSTTANVRVNGRVQGGTVVLKAEAAAYITADFTATNVTINLDSASKYKGDITAKNSKVNLDSASSATVTGDVENLTINVDSAAKFDGKNLKAKFVKVEADSMGKAEVYPIESLNAYADSMGRVIYYNTPKELKKYTDSMGSVKSN
ncbi:MULTISPECIES: GIN domain-containing protein [unclassified Myroides]|uniref:GIN domain-containing protein n=1 Tax=unclassified Myroides TaxID=2642485 RepID=UPI003D2F8CF4